MGRSIKGVAFNLKRNGSGEDRVFIEDMPMTVMEVGHGRTTELIDYLPSFMKTHLH
jgi:hypothetical protein